jgi:hypothetical protein
MKKKIYTRFIAILVSEQTYEQVKMITDKLEISTTQFVRELIQRELKSMNGNGKELNGENTGQRQ